MTAKLPLQWICLGIPPNTEPCPATGSTFASAESHTESTNHSTVSRMAKEQK